MASWVEITNTKELNRYELILSGKEISERIEKNGISPGLFTCTGLNFLQISETCLSCIPGDIRNLNNLTTLILHSNNLSELCPEIGEMTKLKILDASNNNIKDVSGAIEKLSTLTTLNLSFNMIEKIPVLTNNVWLSIVDFSSNKIEDMSELCRPELCHLSELHLKGNKIKEIPTDIKELVALKFLDLSDNAVTQVPGELGDNTKLKDINLQGNPLSDKRLLKLVVQNKSKPILEYIRDRCERKTNGVAGNKGKKGKGKVRGKSLSEDVENDQEAPPSVINKYRIVVEKPDNICRIKRTEKVLSVRQHIVACVVKNVSLDVDSIKKFLQIQNKLHDGICEKRRSGTIATHDLELTKGRNFTYTALPPDELRLTPLFKTKEVTAKELLVQLQAEAEIIRKEKKRNTCTGIHKFLHLPQEHSLYPCVLNSEDAVISFPPITNSEISKVSTNTKNILIEVTSPVHQNICKKIADKLLKEMLLSGIGVTNDGEGNQMLEVEQVRVEDDSGNLIVVYPSSIDLKYEDDTVSVIRNAN
ncbi:UNVERIFIED_CONTAM: hypothetical protein PYX00_009571 [Menopon gallinae]|uniref:B3/B4 tRNA-binding domain-containing protein n=1 Tax=Menopon gallinae TaxID=328185 RepID=A0AAW2HCA2_9NEOP